MKRSEPSFLKIFVSKLAFLLVGRSVYREYACRLPLGGREQVLDFGCGMGTVAYYTAQRLPHGQLVCADISERWLRACRKKLRRRQNVAFQAGRIYEWDMPDVKFHLIYCHYVLHDIPEGELERVIPALAEFLQSEGILTLREPLSDTKKLAAIQRLAGQSGLQRRDSRITDVPLMGNSLEITYGKE